LELPLVDRFEGTKPIFSSLTGDRLRDHTVKDRLTAPLPEYKRGDFSRLLDPSFTGDRRSGTVVGKDALGRDIIFGQIYDPTTTRQLPDGTWIRDPFQDNQMPPGSCPQTPKKQRKAHSFRTSSREALVSSLARLECFLIQNPPPPT